jgi:hypothetical protein
VLIAQILFHRPSRHTLFFPSDLRGHQKKFAKLKKVLEKFGKIFYEGSNIQYRNEARLKDSPTVDTARLRDTDFPASVELLGQETIALSISGSKNHVPFRAGGGFDF